MTSRYKFSTLPAETKRSASISSPKPFNFNSQKKKFSMLTSFPFRYPFASDGCTTSNVTTSTSPQRNSPQNTSNASSLIAEEYTSSSLSGRYYSHGSDVESGSNEEILFNKRSSYIEDSSKIFDVIKTQNSNAKEKNLFFVQDDDDYDENRRHLYDEDQDTFIETYRHEANNKHLETVQSELNFSNLYNASTLPSKALDDSSGLRRYAIRRHHSAPQPDAKWLQAKRKAIVVQMYDTEKSYVEALKILVNKYYLPLKEKDIVERNLINDIFYKIPEIHVHHELFVSSLKTKFDNWDNRQTIGDILLNIFAKQSVIETYISFVNNYRTSQEAIRISKDQSSLFCKFLEQQAKDHRGKLTLKDLIIQPVQRIPRYELYIKDFLKCTPHNHPDFPILTKAQKELHNLAEKIDQVHKEVNESYGSDSLSVLQIIQDLIENLDDLVTAYRYYIRHDMLTIVSSSGMKKDRCLFLFSDLIILTSCKRRSGNINKKPNTIILNSPIGKQYLENSKHKLIMKFQLEDIDLSTNCLTKKLSIEKDFLEEDLNIINRINDLAKNISYPHHNLDESLRELSISIVRQLNETNVNNNSLNSSSSSGIQNSSNLFNSTQQSNQNENTNNETKQNQLVLTINTMDRIEVMTLIFNSQDLKSNWEKCFVESKKTFYESFSRKPASFLSAIAIPRNRSGVNFTCASPRMCNDQHDVWICNTDGQMSQVCILNTSPELAVTSCNTVSNSRITCIQCVPSFQFKRLGSYKRRRQILKNSKKESMETDSRADSATITNSHSINSGFLLREESIIDYDSSDEDEKDNHSGNEEKDIQFNNNPSPNIPSHGSLSINDSKNCTMWIGNEDGSLHIFQFNDSTIRTVARKNRITKNFSAGVQSIVYMDNKVIISLRNGELILFRRLFSVWNFDSYLIKALCDTPFSNMITVAGKLWCSSQNIIKILNPETLDCENQINIENEKLISIAAGGNCTWAVWVACLNNLDLKLYHATKLTVLADINIKQCVIQKLSGIDEIIRIHKISTLKITSLYICKDTLWVGTSAGVIINVKIPHVNNSTIKLNTILNFNALNQGHVGPVRFISSTEVPKTQANKMNLDSLDNANSEKSNSVYKTVVITGGEGYEEYKAASTLGSGISLSNSNTSNVASNYISDNQNNNMTSSGNSILSSASGNNSNMHQISNSSIFSNCEEYNIGKEDLVNFVLSWET